MGSPPSIHGFHAPVWETALGHPCHLRQRDVTYLGYTVGGGRLWSLVDKVQALRDCPALLTKKEVRQFLGLTRYYWFMLNFMTPAAPLSDLTKNSQP